MQNENQQIENCFSAFSSVSKGHKKGSIEISIYNIWQPQKDL